MSDFEDRLRIRFFSHHSRCSQCIRHRLIMKKLGHCPPARRAQAARLHQHLQRQHRDRQVYWNCRAESRLDSKNLCPCQITGILDSMDAAKHAWPRSAKLSAKEFSSFNRPRLTSTSLIIHGHSVTLALSPSTCSSNSSRTSEILAIGLTKLARKLDLRRVFLQADNCSKEVKNNGQLRLLAGLIALGKLRGATLSFLSSGHSHEDIDAMFACIRQWLASHTELPTPKCFQKCLTEFFADPTRRPHEGERDVIMLNQFHDWKQVLNFSNFSFVLFLVYVSKFLRFWICLTLCLANFSSRDPTSAPSRKNFYAEAYQFCQLKGVGGPGAPHYYQLERLGDTGDIILPSWVGDSKY